MANVEKNLAVAKQLVEDVDRRMHQHMVTDGTYGPVNRSIIALSGAVDELIDAVRSLERRVDTKPQL